jgi:hypothetical protein
MKTNGLLCAILLLLSACATNDGFVANDIHQCEPGDPIEIQAGVVNPDVPMDGRMTVLVEVSNNSDKDFTVANVRIDPQQNVANQQVAFDFQGGSRTFDREIKEGESYTFEIPVTIRLRDSMNAGLSRGITVAADAAVTVKLADGDASRCRFVMPVRF